MGDYQDDFDGHGMLSDWANWLIAFLCVVAPAAYALWAVTH